MKIEAVINPR